MQEQGRCVQSACADVYTLDAPRGKSTDVRYMHTCKYAHTHPSPYPLFKVQKKAKYSEVVLTTLMG